jgi:RNA polymerase sigma factor (sigma-70 family)
VVKADFRKMISTDLHQVVPNIWRSDGAKIVASVARLVRDIGLAEDLAQDAVAAALEHWPIEGVPNNPAAWLMTTAKNRALDYLRSMKIQAEKHEQIGRDLEAQEALIVPDFVDALDAAQSDEIGDDLLRLIFSACHPVLPKEARVALTLKLVAGLTTAEIARAYLVQESTIAQRIVRAKRTIKEAKVPFELPVGEVLGEGLGEGLGARLASVLEVVYLIFNEGYTATAGDDWLRNDLCKEAIRLGRLLADLAPSEPEVYGLLALMQLQASRSTARVDASGKPVLLADQDRTRWDVALIESGLAALQKAESSDGLLGPYTLQAEIAACHAVAATTNDTDWLKIVAIYDALVQLAPSPVVELNRAVAVGMAYGPSEALEIVDSLLGNSQMQGYPWMSSVRADLLAKLGRNDEARHEFEHAANLTANSREREFLLERAQLVGGPVPSVRIH